MSSFREERNKIIQEVVLAKCNVKEKLGYKKLYEEDFKEIFAELEEHDICLTKKEHEILGF